MLLRRRYSKNNDIVNLIENIIINEVLDDKLETEYKIKKNYLDEFKNKLTTYSFKTDSGNEYDVDFYNETIDPEDIYINNNKFLSDFILEKHNNLSKAIILGFTHVDNKKVKFDNNDYGTIDDPYIKRTNKNEKYELLSRIIFLIDEFINKNNYKFYIIGKNTYENNLNVYINIFKKLFQNKFEMVETDNSKSRYGSYYFMDKKILK
jgi:hypothetical protein